MRSSLSVFLNGQKIKEKMDLERIKMEEKIKNQFDPKNEYRESIDEFAGATVELLAEVLKKKHPLITKESIHECISMIGFMLFDSYKRKEEINGKL